MGRNVSSIKSIKVTVPQNTVVEEGKFYLLDGFFGLAVQSVTTGAGETAQVILEIAQDEYETDQITTTDAFAKGDPIYWNNTTKLLTILPNDDGTGDPQNRPVGRVTATKDSNNIIWFLLGPQIQAH